MATLVPKDGKREAQILLHTGHYHAYLKKIDFKWQPSNHFLICLKAGYELLLLQRNTKWIAMYGAKENKPSYFEFSHPVFTPDIFILSQPRHRHPENMEPAQRTDLFK